MPRHHDLVTHFGYEAEDCLRSIDIADAMEIPLYAFNYLIYRGKFPGPDFRRSMIRAWKPATVAAHNPAIASRAERIAARRRS
ncbi:MAG TPA: hypothetical protein PKD21_11025 [Candidatus Competibacter phosphatis]|nr:hypothetical protein [Candidatus Competibacter phosphatis]